MIAINKLENINLKRTGETSRVGNKKPLHFYDSGQNQYLQIAGDGPFPAHLTFRWHLTRKFHLESGG
jgi:hypothetical protein